MLDMAAQLDVSPKIFTRVIPTSGGEVVSEHKSNQYFIYLSFCDHPPASFRLVRQLLNTSVLHGDRVTPDFERLF